MLLIRLGISSSKSLYSRVDNTLFHVHMGKQDTRYVPHALLFYLLPPVRARQLALLHYLNIKDRSPTSLLSNGKLNIKH